MTARERVAAPARDVAPPPARVRGNDWRALRRREAGGRWPREGVSVVVPCFEAPGALALALAALGRQTWPRELMEVVVVDDGSDPPLAVPRDAPVAVRVVRQARRGFGLARARNTGVRAARHPIVVFLDGDLVADDGLVAAHARWHHAVADAVTLGFCAYVDGRGIGADALRRADAVAEVFRGRPADRPWTERHMARTDDLTAPRDDLFRSVVGNNLGIRRALFDEIGGFDAGFDRYGWEDTEFGWRAQTSGALLVPVREAFSWHQGRFRPNRTAAKRGAMRAQRAKGAALIPHPHFRRGSSGAPGAVPRTVVRTGAGTAARRLLRGADADLVVEPDAAGGPPGVAAAFVVDVPADAAVDRWFLARMRAGLGDAAVGVATLADGAEARIARTWAVHRARRSGGVAADYGRTATFALTRRGALAAALREALGSLLPTARRPLAGVPRVAAEVSGVRSAGDARRIGRWLAAGLGWWLATFRGGAAARRRSDARDRGAPMSCAAVPGGRPDAGRVWLASYPRSGSTLLRAMLWHGLGLPSTSVYPRDLGGNRALEREVGHFEADAPPPGAGDGPLCVKTHGPPPDAGPAVYVVRDGRAASVSLRRFRRRPTALREVVGGGLLVGTWSGHLDAWRPWARADTLFLRYEAMVLDVAGTLAQLAAFLGRPVRSRRLPDRRRLAALDGRWVRAAPSDWRGAFSPRDLRLFRWVNGDAMAALGYADEGGRTRGRPSLLANLDVALEAAYWRGLRRRRAGRGDTFPAGDLGRLYGAAPATASPAPRRARPDR